MSKDKAKTKTFSPTPYVAFGYATLFLAFGVFGTWAATAPLASGVVAPGGIYVESNKKLIQHFEGGIVETINVKEGDVVEAGESLVVLDKTQAQSNFTLHRKKEIFLLASEARLIAENTRAEKFENPFNEEQMLDKDVEQAVQVQETLFSDRKTTLEGQITILEARIRQLEEGQIGLNLRLEAIEQQFVSIDEEVERMESGQKRGVVSTNDVSRLNRQKLQLQGDKGQTVAEIAQSKQTISENELQIVLLRQEYSERAGTELRDIREQLSEVQERLVVAQDFLKRTNIVAPVRGMVQDIQVHTRGGVLRPAEPIMSIVPLDDDLIVNARVQPVDIDSVQVGMVGEVRFPAFATRNTPAIFGTVTILSQDVIESRNQNELPYYLARIEVDEADIPEEFKEKLVPGMPAEIVVATGDRTLVQYLVKPLMDSFYKSLREE